MKYSSPKIINKVNKDINLFGEKVGLSMANYLSLNKKNPVSETTTLNTAYKPMLELGTQEQTN